MTFGVRSVRYACAVLLIASSIALAFLVALRLDFIPSSVLIYIAQAFLFAGSIFGLDYYVQKLSNIIKNYGSEKQNGYYEKGKTRGTSAGTTK